MRWTAFLVGIAMLACRPATDDGGGFTLLFLGRSSAARVGGVSWAPDAPRSRLIAFDGDLHVVRTISDPRLSSPVAVSAFPGNRLLISERTGEGVVFDTTGKPVREWESPFPASLYATDGARVVASRSPYFVQFVAEDGSAPLLWMLDTMGVPRAGLGTIHVPDIKYLAQLVNSGPVALSDNVAYFAPLVRDEILRLDATGSPVWRSSRGLIPVERDPRFLAGKERRVEHALINIAMTIGPNGRLYVLGAQDSAATRLRLDVLDRETGEIVESRVLGTPTTAVAVNARGRIGVFDPEALLAQTPTRGRELFTPPFALPDLAGKLVRLEDYRGKVTLVNFWASWCEPCREEFPHMAELYRGFDRRDFDIAAISDDVSDSKMRGFVREFRPPFPILAGRGRMKAIYHFRGLPYSVLIDRNGLTIERFSVLAVSRSSRGYAQSSRGRSMLILLLVASLQAPGDWPAYGRDPGGARFSPLTQITRQNVTQLQVAWTYHTGMPDMSSMSHRPPALEVTPLVVDGTMYVISPTGIVAALDPETGTERWRFDAGVNPHRGYGDFASRGVSFWRDPRAAVGSTCAHRIFAATIDARLYALDAGSGRPCAAFGTNGAVDLRAGLRVPPLEFEFYEVTSPPAIVGDLVITGSAVADNTTFAPASGEVRAFDARTGALRWTFDPVPRDSTDPAYKSWLGGSARYTGAANVWSVIVADPARDLVFLPTSSPAPDYYGGLRLGEDRYANSIVALRASTGKVVWHFQTVHHDIWDYDNAASPALVTVIQNGVRIPAVIQTGKSAMLYILDRTTGKPLFPVEERPVPASSVPGEIASPTQPFTTVTPPLSPLHYSAADAWGPTPEAQAACRAILGALRNDGPFTPPSLQGTLVVPGNIGGAHWGGMAIDEGRALAVVPVNRIPAMVQLFVAEGFNGDSIRRSDAGRGITDFEYTRMRGTPYVMRRRLIMGPTGLPCTPPPFGSLVAVNLKTGGIAWDVPLGTMGGAAGSPNLGGPVITAGGVVFIGATLDRRFRAFDIETGRELWSAPLPAGARATPMTYEAGGRQFVVIAAGGGGPFGAGDAIIAFALPR